MIRISDAASINSLINNMMRTKQRVDDANFQVVSGKVSREYAGIARESQRLVSMEATRDLNVRFIENNKIAKLRLDTMTNSIESSEKTIKDMRRMLGNFLTAGKFDQNSVENLQKFAFNALLNLEAYLNVEIDGQFLFSGSRTNELPVDLGLTNLEAFQQDYDGSISEYPTTRDAHLVQLSMSEDTTKQNLKYITSSNWLTFRQDDDGDATDGGTSSIEATSALFSDYEVGSRINVTGTANNNGEYTVQSVSSDGTKIFVTTEMLTAEETPLGLTDETTTGVAQVDTLTLGGTFEAGDVFTVNINGTPLSYTAVAGDIDIDGVRSSLRAAINADPTLSGIVTASDGGAGELVLTADNPGVSFTTTAFAANGGVTDDSTITITNTTPNDGNVTFTLDNGTTISNDLTGDVTFDRSAGTIAASNANAFDAVSVGDVINISGDNASKGTYVTVTAIGASNQTLTVTAGATITTIDGTVIDANDTARMIFDRTNDTITADNAVFGDLRAGDKFTVAGTLNNNGDYTVSSVSDDGRTITIASSKLTDEGSGSGSTFFDYNVGTRFQFDATAETIQAQNIDGSLLTGAFSELEAGDSFTLSGTVNNDGIYTVGSISTDGATITLAASTPLVGSDAIDNDGAGVAAPARNFTLRTGNGIVFTASSNTITLQDITSAAGTEDIFDNLRVGQQITISGTASNNGTFTIASIAPDGASFTVSEDITVDETFDPSTAGTQVSLQIFSADGTIESSQSYYGGNDFVTTHRVDERRLIDWDVNASHPAFEKAIRAMGILAQGQFGSEGGLDQNTDRIKDALYLLNDSITSPAEGTPPYGDEIQRGMDDIFFDLGLKQVVIKETNVSQENFNNLLEGFITDTEDVDKLEAITRLLDEQRALSASYQAMSRVFTMSLADFL